MASFKLDFLVLAAAFIACLTAIAQVALLDKAKHTWDNSSSLTGSFYWPDIGLHPHYRGPSHYVDYTPLYLNWSPLKLSLAVGALSVFTSVLAVLPTFWFLRMNVHRKPRVFLWCDSVSVALNCISALICMATLVYVFVTETRNSEWHYSGPSSPDGHWTLGGWTCEIRYQRAPWARQELNIICDTMRAAKWVLIPLMVMTLITAILQIFAYRNHRTQATLKDSSEVELKKQSQGSGVA